MLADLILQVEKGKNLMPTASTQLSISTLSGTAYHRLTMLQLFLHKADSKASQRLSIRACTNLRHDNERVNRNTLKSIYLNSQWQGDLHTVTQCPSYTASRLEGTCCG